MSEPKKILVIEDTVEVRENIVEILELDGYEVFSAGNGKEGVRQAREHLPALILCDIMMPELDGYGVLRILQDDEATVGIPFVFLTAKAERTDFRKGMTLGADDYITKPFEDVDLLDTVKLRISRGNRSTNDRQRLDEHFQAFHAQEALTALRADREQRTFGKGEKVITYGEQARYFFHLESGSAKTVRFNSQGKELITDLLRPGNYFGIQNIISGLTYTHEVVALNETCVSLVPRDALLELLQADQEVNYQLLRFLAARIEKARQRQVGLAYEPVRQRVAAGLLDFAGENNEVTASREDLAALCGTAKETLIRNLSDLKAEKLLEVGPSGAIEILDREGLERIVEL